MAQVIQKFAGGGSYGTFTRNGIEYEIDDDALNMIAAESAPVADALRQGKNITTTVDSDGNVTIYGIDESTLRNNGLTDRNIEKLSRKQRLFEKRKLKDLRRGYSAMGNIPLKKKQPIQNQGEDKKQLDMTDLLTLDYVKNEDGSLSLGSSANNKRIKDRLNMYLGNLNGDWDEYLVYNTFNDRDAANAYTDSIRSKINDDFWKRLESGKLTEDDKLILQSYGIQKKDAAPTQAELDTAAEKEKEGEFNKGGLDYSTYKDRFVYKDGTYTLNDSVLAQLLNDETGNLWLNDDFKSWASKKGYDASWIPQGSGLFRINGKWFEGKDLSKITGNEKVAFDNWVANNRETVGGSNDLIKQYWELTNPYHKASQVNGYSWSINPEDYYYDRSGQFKRESSSSPLVYDIVTPEIRKNNANFNQFGHLLDGAADRIFINPYTKQRYNYSIDMDPENDMDIQSKYYSDENTNRQTAFSNYATYGGNKGKLAVVQAWGDPEAKTGWALLYNPENKQYYWHNQNFRGEGQDLNTGIGNVSQSAIQIDPEMAKWLQQHMAELNTPELAYYIDRIIGNPFLRNFSGKYDADTGDSVADRYNLNDLIRSYNNNGYTFYIGGRPVKFNFDNGGNKGLYGSGNMARHWGLVLDLDNPLEYKNGGVIKMQTGGVLYNTENKASKSSITPASKPIRAAHKEKILGDGTELTSADWAEIGALVGDAAALGATFIPVYGNATGAVTGALASTANLYSDIKRDGFDWGDIGNFGLNLGLDLATLIPGLGTGAKAAKIAKALKKSKAVGKMIAGIRGVGLAASGAGVLSAAVTSWDKLQNGDWTIGDIRNIVNGIRGYKNIGKLRSASVKGNKLTETTLGKGDKKITVTREELDDIRSKPKSEQTEAAKKLISSKLKLAEPITAEEAGVIAKADNKTEALEQLFKKKGISLTKEETNTIINDSKGTLLERINNAIKEKTPEVNVSDYFPTGFSMSSSGTWYKPWSYFGKSKVKDINFGKEETVLNPEDANWWQYINGKRTAALRNAATDPENPYFKIYGLRKETSYKGTPVPNRTYQELGKGESDMPPINSVEIEPRRVSNLVFGTTLPVMPAKEDPKSPIVNEARYYPIYRKKGGKIIKAQLGTNSIMSYGEVQNEANRRRLASKFGVSPTLNFSETPNKIILSSGHILNGNTGSFTNNVNENLVNNALNESSTFSVPSFKPTGTSIQETPTIPNNNVVQRGKTNFKFNIDPKKIVDPIRAIKAFSINNEVARNSLKGNAALINGLQETAPQLKRQSYYFGDINRAEQERLDNIKPSIASTNDSKLNMINNLMRSRTMDSIIKEANAEKSKRISSTNLTNLDIDNRQRLIDAETSNKNRKVVAQGKNMDYEILNRKAVANGQGVWLPVLNQLSQDIALDQNDRTRALMAEQLVKDQNTVGNAYNTNAQEGINIFNSVYDKVKNNENARKQFIDKFGDSADDYVHSKLGNYRTDLMNWLSERQATSAYTASVPRVLPKLSMTSNALPESSTNWNDLLNFKYNLTSSHKMKKGGTLQRYRPFNEQILLDENKEIRKALSKMDDNLIKLLLKMLS